MKRPASALPAILMVIPMAIPMAVPLGGAPPGVTSYSYCDSYSYSLEAAPWLFLCGDPARKLPAISRAFPVLLLRLFLWGAPPPGSYRPVANPMAVPMGCPPEVGGSRQRFCCILKYRLLYCAVV